MTTEQRRHPVVREPVQGRSREAWRRILDAGLDVLAEVGVARFSVAAVCARARVKVTAVYTRVDTRDDLLHAVYDHGAALVEATEAEVVSAAGSPDPHAAVDFLAAVFDVHRDFLRPTVLGSNEDGYIAERGRDNLARARQRFILLAVGDGAPPVERERAQDLFAVAFSTLAFELAFGPTLLGVDGGASAAARLRVVAEALFPPANA